MKTNLKLKLTMKVVAILMIFTLLSSCAEDEVEQITAPEEAVESDEIVEIISGAMAKDAQGMTAQLEAAAIAANEADFDGDSTARNAQVAACGQEFADEFTLNSKDNQAIVYDYAFAYFYAYQCNEFQVPNTMNFAMTQSGTVDAPRFASTNESSGGWTLSGLEIASTQYFFEGEYEREGTHESKIGEQNGFDFGLSVSFSDVKMNKGNYVISGGLGSFSVAGEAKTGESFSVAGSIEFLGNQEAKLTINGDAYMIDLKTGEVTPL